MDSVVADNELVININLCSVIREEIEFVLPRLIHPEPSLIVDAKPFSPAGHARYAGCKKPRIYTEGIRIDWRRRVNLRETRKVDCPRSQQVYVPAQGKGI